MNILYVLEVSVSAGATGSPGGPPKKWIALTVFVAVFNYPVHFGVIFLLGVAASRFSPTSPLVYSQKQTRSS